MRKETLKRFKNELSHLKRDMEGREDDPDYMIYAESELAYLEKAIEWLESLPTPELLDPYTCDLCVGDVVEHTGSVCKIKRISPHLIYPYQLSIGGWVSRSDLKLIHRSGATIKEVGNGTITPSP